MRTTLLTALLTLTTLLAVAQDTPEQIIEKFFQDYDKEEPGPALDNLYSKMPYKEKIQVRLDTMRAQFIKLQDVVGEYHGHSMIANKDLANCLSVYSYLVKFEMQPVRFTFEFYKPKAVWRLNSFTYDDNVIDELGGLIRLHNIK